MSNAHIWDQSGVGALNQLIRKLRKGGSQVEVEGLNEESLDLFERIGDEQPPIDGTLLRPERCWKTVNLATERSGISAACPHSTMAQPQVDPLAEPLTRDELKPCFAIVECGAIRSQAAGCARISRRADVSPLCDGTLQRHGL